MAPALGKLMQLQTLNVEGMCNARAVVWCLLAGRTLIIHHLSCLLHCLLLACSLSLRLRVYRNFNGAFTRCASAVARIVVMALWPHNRQ